MKKDSFEKLAEKLAKDEEIKTFATDKLLVVSLLSLLAAISFTYITLNNIADYRGDVIDLLAIIFDILLVCVWISTAVENAVKRKKVLQAGAKKTDKKAKKEEK